jgi:putative phosphoesterase
VRIGLLADAHSNAVCLDRAIGELRGRVDRIFLAGDAISAHRFSKDVIELIQAHDIEFIAGNHERDWLSPQGIRARQAATAADIDFIAAAPMRREFQAGKRRVLMVHGSPWPPYDEYLFPASPVIERLPELGADFVFLGHTHQPMIRRVGPTLVVNPGSVGDPRGPGTRGMVTYAVVDTDAQEAVIERFPWVPPGRSAI